MPVKTAGPFLHTRGFQLLASLVRLGSFLSSRCVRFCVLSLSCSLAVVGINWFNTVWAEHGLWAPLLGHHISGYPLPPFPGTRNVVPLQAFWGLSL